MTRIIAGSVGGRTIAVPPRGTRPTSDRVREALFARLDHLDAIEDARVLDLYAGSGALGLEAASRGAAQVDLVESDARAAAVCRSNTATLGLDQVRTYADRVESFLARSSVGGVSVGAADAGDSHGYHLVFVDPPYDLADDRLAAVLAALAPRLAQEVVVVLERSSRSPVPDLPAELALAETRKYGETVLHLLERAAPPTTPSD